MRPHNIYHKNIKENARLTTLIHQTGKLRGLLAFDHRGNNSLHGYNSQIILKMPVLDQCSRRVIILTKVIFKLQPLFLLIKKSMKDQ